MTAPRIHGGPDAQGAAPHDFSTNANACGPCPPALQAVAAADATRYPDPAYTGLRAALAARHEVDAGRVVLAGSASEFIFRISAWTRLQGGSTVALPRHGYGDYGAAARAFGLAPAPADTADLAWACEPSSPLGAADDTVRQAGHGTLVLDRAYEPLRLEGVPLPHAEADRCWQLWSPNKALGLTGVRAAYAIAPAAAAHQARGLEQLAPSWPVGAHGVALLQAWCDPQVQEWLARSLPVLREWKAMQLALCRSFGWTVRPGMANFFTAAAPLAARHLEQLRTRGVRLRDCSSFGLAGHVRLGVLPPESQRALQAALEALA